MFSDNAYAYRFSDHHANTDTKPHSDANPGMPARYNPIDQSSDHNSSPVVHTSAISFL